MVGLTSLRYGDKVERYMDVFLRTPGISNDDIARAQLARGNARRIAAERLLAQAHQGLFRSCDVLTTILTPLQTFRP